MGKLIRKSGGQFRRMSADYKTVHTGVVELLDVARRTSARVVNSLMTATYWEIGRRIVEHEQAGEGRAAYGEELARRLATDLTKRFGRGFGLSQIKMMRQFYQTFAEITARKPLFFPAAEDSSAIGQSLIGQSDNLEIRPAAIGQSPIGQFKKRSSTGLSESLSRLRAIACAFPLPWTHYVRLLRVHNAFAREFYVTEAFTGGWSVRQLDRQINSQFYERTALSKNKVAMLLKGAKPQPEDAVTAEEEIRHPLVLEFLNLKDEYSESDLEEALIRHLETFLLELGNEITFVGRQKRLRIGHEWFRVDLVFFHRRLRCLLIIDLKIGALVHADTGQMNLYCNFAREHWMQPGENPPVGLILCAGKDDVLASYATAGLGNKLLVREYLTALPDETEIAAEIARTRKALERRAEARSTARSARRPRRGRAGG